MKEFLNNLGLIVIITCGLYVIIYLLIERIVKNKRVIIINDYRSVEEAFLKAYLENNDHMKLIEKTVSMTASGDPECDEDKTSEEHTEYTQYTEYTEEEIIDEIEDDDIIKIRNEEERRIMIEKIKYRIEENNRKNL